MKLIKIYCIIALTGILVSQKSIDNSRQNAITNSIKEVGPAVVGINVKGIEFQSPFRFMPFRPIEVESNGSGVVISPDGYIITNYHVVENASKIIVTITGGKQYDAEFVGWDELTDLAVLKLDGRNFPYVNMGNSDDLIIGEWVIALGNPFGLFDANQQPTATIGIISGKNLDFGLQDGKVYQNMIQTDAAIKSGNSGGPLVNSKGELIGINTFVYSGDYSSKGSSGFGFAIPINRARSIAEELKRKGRINRGKLGFNVYTLNPRISAYLNIPFYEGLFVKEILKNGPASKAKLEIEDVIVELEGKKVKNIDDFNEILAIKNYRSGDKLKLKIWRRGRYLDRTLILG